MLAPLGVPPTEVAAWAGHSVEVLMRVYARCMTGFEAIWIARIGQLPSLGRPLVKDLPGEDRKMALVDRPSVHPTAQIRLNRWRQQAAG